MTNQKDRLVSSLKFPFLFIVFLWAIHLLQVLFNANLGAYGVYPRQVFGLRGILFSPLIHDDLRHLISNSAPLFVLSVMILYFYRRVAYRSMLMIYLLTGVAVWLFARPVYHIGASGVVYGFVSFVFWSGIFRRSIKSIILALIVIFLYSGYFLGILPNQEGISWESHLLGGVVGIFTAYWYKEEIEADEEHESPSWENESQEKTYFLDRGIFDKTKKEREKEQQNEGQD